MIKNVGSTDKIIRIIVGIVLLAAGFLLSLGSTLKIILIVVGLINLVTAFTSFCLLYTLFGINTGKVKASQ